jgi:hypothetical protein
MIWLLVIIAILIFVGIGVFRLLKTKIAAAQSSAASPPPGQQQNPIFSINGNEFEITPAKPCEVSHGCKYVAPVVSITEVCEMKATEDAIATVTKNTKRVKKILVDARQALLEFTSDAPVKPEAVT